MVQNHFRGIYVGLSGIAILVLHQNICVENMILLFIMGGSKGLKVL